MVLPFLLAFAWCIPTFFAHQFPTEDGVIVLTQDTFDDAVKTFPVWMLEVYAPWCGHCQKLAPEYSTAATTLSEQNLPIPLAKIDGTKHQGAVDKLQIQGYPSLLYYEDGTPTPYTGPRTAEAIVAWIQQQQAPVIREAASAAELNVLLSDDTVSLVLFAPETSEERSLFDRLRKKHKHVQYIHATDSFAEQGVTPPAIVLFTPFDERRHNFQENFSFFKLERFVKTYSRPLLPVFDKEVVNYVFRKGLKGLFVFLSEAEVGDHRQELEDLAKSIREDFVVTLLDLTAPHIDSIGSYFGINSMPAVGLVDNPRKYVMPHEFSIANIRIFLDEWRANEVTAQVKSQPLPTDPYENGVRILVASNFNNAVDEEKDVLVEFYAPWCQHCREFQAEYEALALDFSTNSNVEIAKINVDENELPGLGITSLPSFKLYPAGNRGPISFDGDRTKTGLKNFILRNTRNKHTDL